MNKMEVSTIGERIKTLRKKRGYNQKDLANLLGKSLRTIQKYESGEIEISIAMVNELGEGVDTTLYLSSRTSDRDFKFDSLSDVMECLFQLEKISGLHFSIETKRPPHDDGWQCSITFDGKDKSAEHNDRYVPVPRRMGRTTGNLSSSIAWAKDAYEDWKDKTLADYASQGVEMEEPENLEY